VADYSNPSVAAGVCIRGSLVPEAGILTAYLKFPVVAGNKVHKMDPTGIWSTSTKNDSAGWSREEPSVGIGESVL
jgi:hypothetical protein